MPINVSVIAVKSCFSHLVHLQFFPHLKVVSHLGGMLTLFKVAVFLNHRIDHRGSFLPSSTTRKTCADPLFFALMVLVIVGETNVINVFPLRDTSGHRITSCVGIREENLNRNPSAKTKGVDENLPLIDVGQLVVAVVVYATDKERQSATQMSMFEDEENVEHTKEIRVYYSTDRWAGYKHQPQKNVYYYGMSYFIPYQEQNSNLLRDSNANITDSIQFDDKIINIVADILSINYTKLQNNHISNEKRTESVLSASKNVTSYSENHMGCGEGRLLKLVHALETAPNKSLFVIEEPETALHQLAQHKLALYFLDICNRKKHQIIFTTHSPDIQQALPIQARKYIQRENDGTTSVMNSPSIAQIQNYFSGGYIKKMIVVTEDDIGKLFVLFVPRYLKIANFSQ